MKYEKIVTGKFIERPNRFVAFVTVKGERVKTHVKNTGRCKELLIPGADVYLEDFKDNMGKRNLRYSLIGVEKDSEDGKLMVNMDSQAPNKIVKESLISGILKLPGMSDLAAIKPEFTYGQSRLDFYIKDIDGAEAFIEVKGVTLEKQGMAMFPDAPTERGIKHLYELRNSVREGKKAFVIFVIQMKGVSAFKPNDDTHKAFGDALREVRNEGVIPLAYDCNVGADFIELGSEVKVKL